MMIMLNVKLLTNDAIRGSNLNKPDNEIKKMIAPLLRGSKVSFLSSRSGKKIQTMDFFAG